MKNAIIDFIKRYPFTFVSIILSGILVVWCISFGSIVTGEAIERMLNKTETLTLTSCVLLGSFLFSNIFDIYFDKLPEKLKESRVILNLVASIIAGLIYTLFRAIPFLSVTDGFHRAYYLPLIYLILSYYFVVRKKKMEFASYLEKVFVNELIVFVFECIIIAGVLILFFIYGALFKTTDFEILFYTVIFVGVVIGYIGQFLSAENVEGKKTLFEKILIKYVMCIMVLVGYVFFYIYFVKIIISREMPSNQVYLVCILLFSIGLATALMSRGFGGDSIYDKVINSLPIAYIPALLLQCYSLFLRVNQYGLTMTRYAGFAIIVFEIFYIIVYIKKFSKMRIILLAAAILVFVMTIVPIINIYTFPGIYNGVFHKEAVWEIEIDS